MATSVYLDNAATTPMHSQAVRAMLPFFSQNYGNPSSSHAAGEAAQAAVQHARQTLARAIGAKSWELIFTSGGTEANNLALRGVMSMQKMRKKLIISAIEHSSVWELAEQLKIEGYKVVIIPVDHEGTIHNAALERAIDEKTALVSIMHVNNEIGTIQDITRIGTLCRRYGAHFHTDAVQSFGKLPLHVGQMNVDILTASAHKIGGPKGIGFLYVREGILLQPLLLGGGQERGMRGGTENVAGIVGFAAAYEFARRTPIAKIQASRDVLMHTLENLGGIVNGSSGQRIHTNLNISFPGVDAELLVRKLSSQGVYCSTQSACLSKQQKENRVLHALGLPKERIVGSVRLTLASPLTRREHEHVARVFARALR